MHGRFGRLAMAIALAATLPVTVGAAPIAAPSSDLRESYDLLTTTYYSNVDPQKLLDGARTALDALAHKKGANVVLPAIQPGGSSAANVAQIDADIQRVQHATHESSTVVTYDAIAAMAKAVGDRWTQFFTPDEYKQFNDELDPQKIAGIGVLIQADSSTKYISAYYVVPGTPADKAGIVPGDVFTSVDGVSTKGFTSEQAVKALRGKPGTQVALQVVRDGRPLPAPIELTRSEVQPPTVIYKMLPQHIGYISIFAFGRDTPDEFTAALNRLDAAGVRAYVLDLRNNGGGYVNSALDISSKFISDSALLTIEERGPHVTTIDAGSDAVPRRPMTILVNRYTASASEITAGALQDDGVAVLVGEKTFGKGVMQSLTPLPDGAAIKITTAHYLTPKNHDINLKGIEPDFTVVENKDARYGEVAHDAQLQAALTILSKKIAAIKGHSGV
jgi:carboxyl-terminal processing protease